MITPKEYYILSFDTTTDAMQAEKLLKDYFNIAIMPVPREISSGCGLSIRFQEPDETSIIKHLKETPVIHGTLYKMSMQKIDGKRNINKLFSP
ncbi:MAG: DUF3343 domain-containing protein [Clostridiales bacterium]|nr:DUF3343 domain-containing protein [Clostridiales bacterium]